MLEVGWQFSAEINEILTKAPGYAEQLRFAVGDIFNNAGILVNSIYPESKRSAVAVTLGIGAFLFGIAYINESGEVEREIKEKIQRLP